MRTGPIGRDDRCGEGSILIEVMVATLLLGILMVSLAGAVSTALHRADGLWPQAAESGAAGSPDGAIESWQWGAEVVEAWWHPGPRLNVLPRKRGGVPYSVGLWVDGWFLGETTADAGEVTSLGPAVWSSRAGADLVVRVRTAGGAWGPPWRSLVPDVWGEVALPDPLAAPSGEAQTVVVHAPAAGNPMLQTSWGPSASESGPIGTPIVLQTPLTGPFGLTLDSSSQAWTIEAGRDLDVYF